MPAATFSARPVVTVGGVRLSDEYEQLLRRVEVGTDVIGPSSVRIVVDDPRRSALADGPFAFGQTLAVAASDGRTETKVFDGVVVGVGFDFDDDGAHATITGFDHGFTLFNGTHTVSYQNVSDSDIASRVAGQLGLDASEVDSSPIVHEHIGQINETHWEFLNRRAAEIDFEVRVVENRLQFRKAVDASTGPDPGDHGSTEDLQLTPGADLLRFSARLSSVGVVDHVEVRGWDVAGKQALTSTASVSSRSAQLTSANTPTAGSAQELATAIPLTTQAECDARAAAEAQRIAGSTVHAEGVVIGLPSLQAGVSISVGRAGGRLDGRFTVTQARHVWSGPRYRTHFVASGVHDRTLLGLLETSRSASRPRMAGPAVAMVTNASDPQNMGRVKLKFPWLSDDYETDWTRVATAGAGDKRGLLLTPEVDDEVLVAFEHNDPRRPVVLGGMFNGSDAPPNSGGVDNSSGKVTTRALVSRKGHSLTLADTDGSEQVSLTSADGKLTIVVDIANSAVRIESSGDVSIKADGNLDLECRDFSVDAKGSVTVKSDQSMTLQATAQMAVKGQQISLN